MRVPLAPHTIDGMHTTESTTTTRASRDRVWALIADASTWATWGPWSRVEIERGAQHGPDAVRVLSRGPMRLRELVTDWQPGERMAYRLLEGMNVRDYRSAVTLRDLPDGGTELRWRSTWDRADPLTAFLLRSAVRDVPRRIARAAES